MAAKKKKTGAGSKGKAANASSDSSTSTSKTAKTKRSASTSTFTADVGGELRGGLAAQLPEGFFIKRMPADGDCLFSAVDDQVTCLLESDPGALSSRR